MARIGINTGSAANDNTGSTLRAAGGIINDNFSEIYTYFGDGTNLTSIGGTWTSTSVGIHTLKNVGIGTTNPTSALTVTGNGTFTGVVTATTFVGALTGTASTATLATNAQGLTGTPNITVGVATASRLNVGTSGTIITTTASGLVGIGTTNPRFTLEVGAVGASGTTLFVNGDARVTGIVTIGPASITLNGTTNIINVGTGITINGSTGIISATAIVLGGTTLTGAAVTFITAGSGISVNQSTGNVTITATGGGGSSQWVSTAAGIHTLSNVGIGTTNPTSALTVTGNGTFTGVVTATTFVGALTGTATTATNAQGLTGTPNITVGVATITGDALINGLTVGRGGSAEITNTAIGSSALSSNTTGSDNVANGYNALRSNTTADGNVANGANALLLTTNGSYNVAIGNGSLFSNTTGNFNTATGRDTLKSNTTSSNNNATGNSALYYNTGNTNVAVGAYAGQYITTGSKNTLLGSYTGNQNGLDIRTSSNNVVLSDGDGNIRFYANSSGNVGLGTTNPTSALTVTGNGTFTGVVTATTFVGALTGTATSTTNIPNLIGNIVSIGNNTSLGSITSAALRTALTSSTGTGDAVFATSPTFFTPALGTPASGTLTNCTFPTLNQNTTGTAGGLSGTPNITVGVVTATTLNVGTGGTIITTTTAGLVGIGTTNPTQKLDVTGNIRLRNALYDVNNNVGTASSVLISTGIGVSWISISNSTLNFKHNVMNYGAVSDGTTNDTEAFNAAILAAGNGGIVYAPPGNYKVNQIQIVNYGQQIIIDGTLIVGSGHTAIVFNKTSGHTQYCKLYVNEIKHTQENLRPSDNSTGISIINGSFNTIEFGRISFLHYAFNIDPSKASPEGLCSDNRIKGNLVEWCRIGVYSNGGTGGSNHTEHTMVEVNFFAHYQYGIYKTNSAASQKFWYVNAAFDAFPDTNDDYVADVFDDYVQSSDENLSSCWYQVFFSTDNSAFQGNAFTIGRNCYLFDITRRKAHFGNTLKFDTYLGTLETKGPIGSPSVGGIILTASDSSRWRIGVSTTGALSTTQVV